MGINFLIKTFRIKEYIVLILALTFSCKEKSQNQLLEPEKINFETIIHSTEDSNILNEGYRKGWEIIKDKNLTILVNRDIIYYVYKNPSENQFNNRYFLHLVIKETREFINLDFNFNDHIIEAKDDRYRICKRKLPLKDILSITTGQFSENRRIWELNINENNIY